jgi:hypothetical protein
MFSRGRVGWPAAVLLALAGGLMLAPAGRGEEIAKNAAAKTALGFVPADTAFFATTLRTREQIEMVGKSTAWAKLNALPIVKLARKKLEEELAKPSDKEFAQFLKLLEQPENKQLVDLVTDSVSDEVFIYGGSSVGDSMELLLQVVNALRFGPLFMQLSGEGGGKGAEQKQALIALRVLAENLDLIRIPDFAVGFKLGKHKEAAAPQIKRLEELLNQLVAKAPPLKGRIKEVEIGGDKFLNVTLDGALIPWDQVPIKEIEEKEGEFDALMKKLKSTKLSVTLGVKDDYLLLAIGDSPQHITKFGKAGGLSVRPELKPLAAYAEKPLTAMDYVSADFLRKVTSGKKDLDNLVVTIDNLLAAAKDQIPEDQRRKIHKDAEAMAKDFKKYVSEPGALFGFSFLTERGQETYSYNYATNLFADGSKPLKLVEHVGGDPLAFVVGRYKTEEETKSYATSIKWLKIAYGHGEEFAFTKLTDDQKEQYQNVTKVVFPLLRKFDEITTSLFSSVDGQSGFVLDAKWKSKQWQKNLPEMPTAMPFFEMGFLLGVKSEDKFGKAMSGYRNWVNDAVTAVKELVPFLPITFEAQAPETEKVAGGKIVYYKLPEEANLDPQVLPNAGLSATAAVLTFSKAHTARLLATKTPKFERGPLADLDKPLAGAAYFNWAGLLDAAGPWVDFALAHADLPKTVPGSDEAMDWPAQVKVLVEVLKVYRSTTSATYFEGKVLVTHTESLIKDVK